MSRFFIWFSICFLSTFSFAYFYYRISGAVAKINFKIVIVFLIGAISVTCIEYFKIQVIDSFYFFIFFPFMFYVINKMKVHKLIFYMIIVWLYGIMIDLLFILLIAIISYFIGFNFDKYPELISMVLTVLVSSMLIIVSRLKLVNNVTDIIYNKIINIKYLDFLLLLFSMFILTMTITMLANVKNIKTDMLVLINLILTSLLFILFLRFKINEDENAQYLNTLKENNEFYIKMEDENRIFKHNLVAKLLSIKSVSNEKSMGLIQDLIEQFNKSIDFSRNMKVIPYGLNGIIYQKLYPWMKVLKIEISNELDFDIFDVLKPRRYNVLVEKLVIALDNAIEACLKSEDKSLIINIYDDDNICIEIENTFGNDIDLDLLGNKNYSTKGHKHGLGLFSAFRNNEASLTVKVVNNVFISTITAKKHLAD